MDKIDEILTRRVEKILPDKQGLKKLMQKRKIRLYQGFDATGGRLHLGHTVGIRKLMDFANLGHDVIFLFGTGTVLVGDPSQRDTGRKLITANEVEKNIKGWKDQVSPIVNWDKVRLLKNGDWLRELKLQEIIKIASNISAIQLFKRDMFQRRLEKGDTVWYHETMYPLLQGYDSVYMDVDLEIGGTDQEFNMLIGRELMQKMKKKGKYVLTTPMVMGTDGKEMSKSSGNCIWLDDTASDMFGKLMSITDDQIVPYIRLLTNIPIERVGEIDRLLKSGSLNPMKAKKELAIAIVTEFFDKQTAVSTKKEFENTFQKGKTPRDIETIRVEKENISLLDLLLLTKLVKSKNEAKRLTFERAIEVNNQVITDPKTILRITAVDITLKIGKMRFVKIIKA